MSEASCAGALIDEQRRIQEDAGWPFFCVLFFGHAKKSTSPSRRNLHDQRAIICNQTCNLKAELSPAATSLSFERVKLNEAKRKLALHYLLPPLLVSKCVEKLAALKQVSTSSLGHLRYSAIMEELKSSSELCFKII
ncbi:hypothetical protein [Agarivorans litoreus]|uniref:hypothetical protein n=1 Tax=Agarivorans litoreus TaxID=1510455 RepID=UPI001C7D6EB4|nr:hypothetical protein [Agarivorans litoreus]